MITGGLYLEIQENISSSCERTGRPEPRHSTGHWNHQAVELVQELGRRMTAVTEDTREATYLFQRMSAALQRGNAVSFHSIFTTE